ncbi:MAG: hypothetical protein NTW25_07325 [Candidatus Kapabacteria bacterium]|nr:hypothetical protein [Candidatus Kapabacteria bacterium]
MSKNEIIYIFKFLFILILPFSFILFAVNYTFDYIQIFKNQSTYLDNFNKSIVVLLMMSLFSLWNQNKRPRLLIQDKVLLTKTMAIFNTILFLFLSSVVLISGNYIVNDLSLTKNSNLLLTNFYFNVLIITAISLVYLFRKLKTLN